MWVECLAGHCVRTFIGIPNGVLSEVASPSPRGEYRLRPVGVSYHGSKTSSMGRFMLFRLLMRRHVCSGGVDLTVGPSFSCGQARLWLLSVSSLFADVPIELRRSECRLPLLHHQAYLLISIESDSMHILK